VKPCLLRPLARQDRRDEIRYYRQEAGIRVAVKLADALEKALDELTRQPGIGSPVLGQKLGVAGMRTWRIDGFPLTFWYFERETHNDVARLVGQRQDAISIDVGAK
jgi:toxin ParE1/3/4